MKREVFPRKNTIRRPQTPESQRSPSLHFLNLFIQNQLRKLADASGQTCPQLRHLLPTQTKLHTKPGGILVKTPPRSLVRVKAGQCILKAP
jgi:hypothetical protein